MNYFAECLARFQAMPNSVREVFGGAETYIAIKKIEEAYKVQLSFLVILVVLGELEENDIEDYLIAKFKVAPESAKKIKEEFIKVFDNAFDRLSQIEASQSNLNNKTSAGKEELINLFSKRLIESLKADADTIFSLNVFIFKTLDQEPELGEKIINILYNNNELVTSERLIYEDKEVAPSISNWIKDFIKVNGSDIFDEVVLAQYLSNSNNTKKLEPEEKDLLRKTLKLYRNLVFYPDSMDNMAPEDWQIIPYEKTEITEPEFKDALDDSSLAEEKIKPELKVIPKSISKPQSKPAAPVTSPEKKDLNPLDELEQTLLKYTPGSLEYKALTQEIIRLKKTK